ncbi:MAG: FIST C-terminal domain-containing protein [Pseudomonadota bacterium]
MTGAAATGLSSGSRATPALAAAAVSEALAKLDSPRANSVLLFLTEQFAPVLDESLRACARAAACTQVMGASAVGVLTEAGWIRGRAACAALVLAGPYRLDPPFAAGSGQSILSFATPALLDWNWLQHLFPRVGAVASASTAAGPHQVWAGSRQIAQGRVQAVLTGAEHAALALSRGVRQLTPPLPVTAGHGRLLLELGHRPALEWLAKSLPYSVREEDRIPLHRMAIGWVHGDPHTAVTAGRYRLLDLLGTDPARQSMELSSAVPPGRHVFLALRDPISAERDTRMGLQQIQQELSEPAFGLLFPCLGRGADFFRGADRDLELMREQFPGLPFIGFYGSGEIGPLEMQSQLFQYTAIMAAFGKRAILPI